MNRTVFPCHLKFHGSDEPRPASRFKVPFKECSAQCWSVAGIDGENIGARRNLQAQCRVQIAFRRGGPSPD
jgi:hypothetical protein